MVAMLQSVGVQVKRKAGGYRICSTQLIELAAYNGGAVSEVEMMAL